MLASRSSRNGAGAVFPITSWPLALKVPCTRGTQVKGIVRLAHPVVINRYHRIGPPFLPHPVKHARIEQLIAIVALNVLSQVETFA